MENKFFVRCAALLPALAVAVLAGCEPERPVVKETVITANQELSVPSRTCVEDGGTQVLWGPGDKISLFFRGEGAVFTSQNTSNAASATFTGELSTLAGVSDGAFGGDYLWGLYPYRADAVSDGSSVTTVLPSEQVGLAGSFAPQTHISLAAAESFNLDFYNITGGLRFSLTQSGVQSVTLKGADDEVLAGKVQLGFLFGSPAIYQITEPATEVTLTAPEGGFEPGKWYYIVTFPTDFPHGFTLTFNTSNAQAKLTTSSYRYTTRGCFGSIPDADKNLIFIPSDDDEIGQIGPLKYLYGQWILTQIVEKPMGGGTPTYTDASALFDQLGFAFDKDRTGHSWAISQANNMNVRHDYTWSLSGNTIYVDIPSTGQHDMPMVICTLTEDDLITDMTVSTHGNLMNERVFYVFRKLGHESVDLGLSVKWAACNVGAGSPEEYGGYYAWGETEPKASYSWSNYKWCNGSYDKLTKYNTQYSYGTLDNKKVLESGDDAATVNMGGSWRTPTAAEWEELAQDCNWQWTTVQGVKGFRVSGKKSGYTGKSIFLPASGEKCDSDFSGSGSSGTYWSSNINLSMPFYSRYISFTSGGVEFNSVGRNFGFTVRAVRPLE